MALEMMATCSTVEQSLHDVDAQKLSDGNATLQNLDRMTQNLAEISKLMNRLATAGDELSKEEISEAVQEIALPSLRSFLEWGENQSDQGSVELF